MSDKTAKERQLAGQRKGGRKSAAKRWAGKDPNSKRVNPVSIFLSDAELELLNEKAISHGISKTELLVRALTDY